tara:strand:+ start:19 stop:219 length:201 start_codon:yes stop_codon:yes gene_type:complete
MNKQLKDIYENMKQIIEVSQQRGCWKASEIKSIGILYETIVKQLDESNKSNKSNKSYESDESDESD